MFSCLSRKDRPQQYYKTPTYQSKKSNKPIQVNSVKKVVKEQSITLPLKVQKVFSSIPNLESKPTLQVLSFQDSPRQEVSSNQINLKVFNDIKLMEQSEGRSQEQLKGQYKEQNSQTSFQIFLERQQKQQIKAQIEDAVQNLTNRGGMPFLKSFQSSLNGMYKYQSNSKISSEIITQLNEEIQYKNLNEEFSRNLIEGNYAGAYEIFEKMNETEKNAYDNKGYTPVYLATLISIYKQGQALTFLKKILKDSDINPSKKTLQGFKPLEETVLYVHMGQFKKSIPTLTNIFRASYFHKIAQVKKSLKSFAATLLTLPDLQLELYVKVGSFVPLVDRITPDDTIKIYKRGQNLRIDYSLVGYSFLQSKRRAMSCIIERLSQNDYTALIVNHDKKCCTDLLQPFQSQQLVLIIQDLLSTEVKRTDPKVDNAELKPQYNIFGELIRENSPNGISIKHELKATYTSKTEKLQPRSLDMKEKLTYLDSWDDYQLHKPTANPRKKKKQLNLGVWICKQYQLKLQHLLEIMKFLSFSHETGEIVYNFLSDQKIQSKIEGFPVKIQIPMSFSLYLDIKITKISLKCSNIEFNYLGRYEKMKRMEYQKTLQRQQKRTAIIKFYT